jgi:Leucine-rich repeat (LRR) protein
MGGYNKQEIKDLSQKVEDQVQFLEYFFNTLGSKDTPARDKDVIIRESYKKIFRDGKVQVEDDLLLDRKVITNKDVTAYLKDIEFFFKDAAFKFKVREVKPFLRDNGELSFLVSMDRTITAIGLNKEKISNTQQRFIEVNVDNKTNELKIASVYTTKLSRDKELEEWWTNLSFTWENYFRKKVGLSETDSVTLEHLYKISSIDSINLAGNKFVLDLNPIGALRDLKYIDISNTNITELNPISNVTFLTSLNIAGTPTRDIQFIKYSDRLTHLDISGTQIRNISELENLKQLHTLKMVQTPVESFEVLNSFSSLRALHARESGFNNLENVNELTGLVVLDISKNYLINFELLSNLQNLEEINLQETNILDISPLADLEKLKVVNINQTGVQDLKPISGKPALQRVYADRTQIIEASADDFVRKNRMVLLIHNVENLQTWWDDLTLPWKEVLTETNPALKRTNPTIEDLSKAIGVDSLNLSGSGVVSLGPVLKFKKLNYLNFDNTKVQDLAPLAEVRTLSSISGINTEVRSLQPLTNHHEILYLDFRDSPVTSIDPLKTLSALEFLNVDGSRIDPDEIPEFLASVPTANVIYRSAQLEEWWSMLDDTWKGIFQGQFGKMPVMDMKALHSMTAKSYVEIDNKSISNLQPLTVFVNLRKLSINDVPLMDISAVNELVLLEELRISQAPVSNLNHLSNLQKLTYLNLSNTGIEDLRPLGVLVALERLNLSSTSIKVLKGLETLRELQELDVASTNIRSLKPVMGLDLQRLSCFNTSLNKRAVDSFKKVNPQCEVRFY